MTCLRKEDKTPADWELPHLVRRGRLRPLVRRILYPVYLKAIQPSLKRRFGVNSELYIDRWYWGTRGSDYPALRRLVKHFVPLKNKIVLVAGCGTARDILSWVPLKPKRLIGVDYFNYERAWRTVKQHAPKRIEINFAQIDLENLSSEVGAESIDLIGSDAVFEHIRNMPKVLAECYRVLNPGGYLYANFGPLWYSWGGDHFCGGEKLENGYNHLLLDKQAYHAFLDSGGEFSHSEGDGRTWIKEGLFSYLRPKEYIDCLVSAGFERLYHGAFIEPRAVACLTAFPALKEQLLKEHAWLDLIIGGLTIIYRKPAGSQN